MTTDEIYTKIQELTTEMDHLEWKRDEIIKQIEDKRTARINLKIELVGVMYGQTKIL